jgi:hypothetical protein
VDAAENLGFYALRSKNFGLGNAEQVTAKENRRAGC